MRSLFLFIFSMILVSSCVMRICIEDGCNRVNGVEKDKITDVLSLVKEDYSEMDSQTPKPEDEQTLPKETPQQEVKA